MRSRDRIMMSISHREPDRVPIDFGSMRSTGIATIAYNKLRRKLKIDDGLSRMYDFQQQLAYPEKKIRDLFHVDVIDAGQAFLKDENNWREWILNDGSKCLIPKYLNIEINEEGAVLLKNNDDIVLGIKPKSSLYEDQSYWVYKDMQKIPDVFDKKDLAKHLWSVPSPPWHLNIFDDNEYKIFIKNIKKLYSETNYSVMLAVGCNLFETGTWLRGMENFLCDIYLDKKGTVRLLDKLTEDYIKLLDKVIKGVGKYVDLLQFGDDLGAQNGPFMSPDVFKEIFKPRYEKMWDFVHSKCDCKVFLHSCGSVYELIPHLIDAGLDIINPVQTTAANMEPERLKKEFGKDITFWGGGCNTRDVLPGKSLKEIKEDVKRRIDIFGKGGGFVFNQIHNLLADIPPENIIAMFEAVYEYGKY
ncbi:MAG: uroporphyrinogen decarboxylase family protein [Actinomycetota bacterium]|nr:uroporphyrinogen decarboxylase family protein [Actinomycetota bacterium]